jgi:hypothetical protein
LLFGRDGHCVTANAGILSKMICTDSGGLNKLLVMSRNIVTKRQVCSGMEYPYTQWTGLIVPSSLRTNYRNNPFPNPILVLPSP